MILAFFDNLEDPKRPFLGPHYWSLEKLGVILPKNPIKKALIVIVHELVMIFVFTQFIELYIVRSDLDLVITNLRVSIVSFISIAKANSFIISQTSWKEIFEYITEADKNERENTDTAMRQIVNSYTKYCRRLMKFYWILMVVTCFCVAVTPLIRYLSFASYREAIRNGSEPFPHILSSWVPFDKDSFPGSLITVCLHIICSIYGGLMIAAYDSIVVAIMIFFYGKLKLLREKCKKMFGCNGLGIPDEQAKTAIRELHGIHINLLKYSTLFGSLLSPVMFLYVLMCSVMLCACISQFTIVTDSMQKLLIGQYFVFAITQIFIFCWFSTKVLHQSQKVMMGPYESEWWVMGVKHRRNVLILAEQLKLFPTFKAGPFNYLLLTTFVTILKGSYSYYTLLRN